VVVRVGEGDVKKLNVPGRLAVAAAMAIEDLEGRYLLSAPVLGTDHVLNISGTASADRIMVCRILANGKDEIKISLGRRRWYFSTTEIGQIKVDAGKGDDLVQVDAESQAIRIGLVVYARGGADSITGGMDDDMIYGGDGNDSLSGGGGDDHLQGNAGNDAVFGGKGDDDLMGGKGNDGLNDDRGDNNFDGGGGSDVIKQGIAQPPEFIIGVWGQPSNYAWHWKARGVNTMVAAELQGGTVALSKWDNEVEQNGMYMIRQPSDKPEEDAKFSNLIAWLAPDEPDVHHTDPKTVQATYASLKKANPEMPVFLNFSGGHVVGYQETQWKHPYGPWLLGADWSSNDIYPVAGWNLPGRLGLVGEGIDRLRALATDKPQFAFIETSDQGLAWNMNAPGPTPAQFRTEVWNAVIHGVRGIIYFADQFKPSFSYNAMPAEVEAEMTAQDKTLTALSGVLLSKIDPKGYGLKLPGGMEGTVRVYQGKTYLIVQNMKSRHISGAKIKVSGLADGTASVYGENRTVQISGGEIVDDFEGNTPRVYVVG
jgi:hypothetical protein